MDDDEYVNVSDESFEIADKVQEIFHGRKAFEVVQAVVIVMTNLLAETAPSMKDAQEMLGGISDSVNKSLEIMDRDGFCQWSETKH
jgi:hypothetical protein